MELATIAAGLLFAFPIDPISTEFERGGQIALRKPKFGTATVFTSPDPRVDLDAIFQEDRVGIGAWSNGNWKRTTETCTWLSPALMSRWLGFLARREMLPPLEIGRRWQVLRTELNEKATFVVRLAAYPKLPTFGVGDEERADLSDLDDVRFVVTVNGINLDVHAIQLARWQTRNRPDLDRYRWWLDTPLAEILNPEFEPRRNLRPFSLGEYHAAWYVLSADLPGETIHNLSVRVLSRRKARNATWKVPQPNSRKSS